MKLSWNCDCNDETKEKTESSKIAKLNQSEKYPEREYNSPGEESSVMKQWVAANGKRMWNWKAR